MCEKGRVSMMQGHWVSMLMLTLVLITMSAKPATAVGEKCNWLLGNEEADCKKGEYCNLNVCENKWRKAGETCHRVFGRIGDKVKTYAPWYCDSMVCMRGTCRKFNKTLISLPRKDKAWVAMLKATQKVAPFTYTDFICPEPGPTETGIVGMVQLRKMTSCCYSVGPSKWCENDLKAYDVEIMCNGIDRTSYARYNPTKPDLKKTVDPCKTLQRVSTTYNQNPIPKKFLSPWTRVETKDYKPPINAGFTHVLLGATDMILEMWPNTGTFCNSNDLSKCKAPWKDSWPTAIKCPPGTAVAGLRVASREWPPKTSAYEMHVSGVYCRDPLGERTKG